MPAVPKRPKESRTQVSCQDQGERIHLRFHHGSKGTDPDHFHGQRCKTCPKENPGNESRWRVGRKLRACPKNGSRRGKEADGCACSPGNPPRYLGGYGTRGIFRHVLRFLL